MPLTQRVFGDRICWGPWGACRTANTKPHPDPLADHSEHPRSLLIPGIPQHHFQICLLCALHAELGQRTLLVPSGGRSCGRLPLGPYKTGGPYPGTLHFTHQANGCGGEESHPFARAHPPPCACPPLVRAWVQGNRKAWLAWAGVYDFVCACACVGSFLWPSGCPPPAPRLHLRLSTEGAGCPLHCFAGHYPTLALVPHLIESGKRRGQGQSVQGGGSVRVVSFVW